jgi:hypothetical protein
MDNKQGFQKMKKFLVENGVASRLVLVLKTYAVMSLVQDTETGKTFRVMNFNLR